MIYHIAMLEVAAFIAACVWIMFGPAIGHWFMRRYGTEPASTFSFAHLEKRLKKATKCTKA